ncbi:MAG: hypothetical protein GTN36_04250 [Candidatus Aenigmarchaeota archaeon]|nr:hypothetical protein [Candidatus Aenigmarchaeota archaeon]
MKIYQSVQDVRRFDYNKLVKLIILEALENKELTLSGIREYAKDQHRKGLTERGLTSHLTRLGDISFIEIRENEEVHYRLLERGRNALKEHKKYGIEPSGMGLRNFIRWEIVENGSGTTTNIIDNYSFMFGLAKVGRRRSNEKHKIIDEINSMMKTPEFEFNGGELDFTAPI